MITVRFTDFWDSFDANNSLFVKILSSKYSKVELCLNRDQQVDYEFHSVFPSRKQLLISKLSKFLSKNLTLNSALTNVANSNNIKYANPAKRRIWYTGENLRPPFTDFFDGFLSFDQDSYSGKNAYFPLWWQRLNWYQESNFSEVVGTGIEMSSLMNPRVLSTTKDGFACAFVGNAEPFRMRFLDQMRKLGEVDVYGKSVGRPVKNKLEIANRYKYSVCFENDLYPGYVTEKLIDAYVTKTIPIYWGDLGQDENINRNSYLNLLNFENMEHFLDSFSRINYEAIYSESFLRSMPNLHDVVKVITGDSQLDL